MSAPEVGRPQIIYPESDGKPMAESDIHWDAMVDLGTSARQWFQGEGARRLGGEIYVSGNLLVYFVEGDPSFSVAPDFFAVRGVSPRKRRIYKVWEEGKAPEIVVELTSRSTHLEDLGRKRAIYEELGVKEYFLFDPEGVRFEPPLRGFVLEHGALVPVEARRLEDGQLVFPSRVLGLELHTLGARARWVDPETGQPLPAPDDLAEVVAEERQKAGEAQRQTEAAQRRAEAAQRQAEAAQRRAEAAEAELERLRREQRPAKEEGPREGQGDGGYVAP